MASPAFLGVAATGELYNAYAPGGSGGLTSPLVLTTTIDIPAWTYLHPVSLVLVGLHAPSQFAGGAVLSLETITDDAPVTAMPANLWPFGSDDGDGAFAYDFGRPTFSCFASFDIGNAVVFQIGGSECFMAACYPKRALPSGSQITIPFTVSGNDSTLLRASLLAFQDGATGLVELSARTINPADTSDGVTGTVPLGSHVFSEILDDTEQLIAMAWADDAFSDGSLPIDGTETVDDTSGNWTKVDSGGYAATGSMGGLVYSIFTADGGVIDLTQPMETFEISDGIGVDDQFPGTQSRSGTVMYRTQYAVPPTGVPAASRVFPV